jgi:hypothetical protein
MQSFKPISDNQPPVPAQLFRHQPFGLCVFRLFSPAPVSFTEASQPVGPDAENEEKTEASLTVSLRIRIRRPESPRSIPVRRA